MATFLARSALALVALSPLACVVVEKEDPSPYREEAALRALVERADIYVKPSAPDELATVSVDVRLDGVVDQGRTLALDRTSLYEVHGYAREAELQLALPSTFGAPFNEAAVEGGSASVRLRNVGSRNRELVGLCGDTFELDVRVIKYNDSGQLDVAATSPRALVEVWCEEAP